jgi:hypothetical protein
LKLIKHPLTLGILVEVVLAFLFFIFPAPAFNKGIQNDVVILHTPGFIFARLCFDFAGDGDFYVAALFMTGVWVSAFYGVRYLFRRAGRQRKE